jgi:ribosomal protein S18 acetylase RimI-like enzyme
MMNVRIEKVDDGNKKSQYTNEILRRLPEWFGIEESICDYVEGVAKLPFFCAMDSDKTIGFISIKTHYSRTGDIYVCGVLPTNHRQGVGRMLYNAAEAYFRQIGCTYVIVKTLSDTAQYEPYERTRRFYLSVGFEELLTLTEMWSEENPCLIMIKKLS